jgi:type IV pilus assembly protein PilQ
MVHSCFLLISCSTGDLDENGNPIGDEAEATAPLEDTEIADTAATAAPGADGEDDLESELGGADDKVAAQPPAGEAQAQAEQPPPADSGGDLDLDKELSDQDLQPEPLAKNDVQAEEVPPPAEVAPEVPPPAETPPPASEKAKITNIRFMNNANGGTVVIETTKPVTYQSRMNSATQQFVIEVADVELPASLQRPYNMKEFGSRFGSVNAYQSAGSSTARIVIQMSGAMAAEPLVQQEGTSLVVIPPAPAPVAAATPAPEKQTSAPQHEGALQARTLDEFLTGNQKFYGRAISLQVKDADIRDVVNFLAEESGANIVMSDDVAGKISLKLRKIPWDQALVTVMRSKGLGYTRQGNVLRISTLKALQTETEASN